MTNPDPYRKKAADCVALAATALDPAKRQELLRMAEAYLRLAKRGQRRLNKSQTEQSGTS
jgi:hypothetical protein